MCLLYNCYMFYVVSIICVIFDNFLKKIKNRLGMVARTYNLSTLGGQGRQITRSGDQDHPGQHGEIPSLLKIQKKLAGCGGTYL